MRRWPEPKKKRENSRDGFVKKALSLGIWADVKVLDADDLELWLEQRPAVAAWLARSCRVGRIPDTVNTLEEVWHFWSYRSKPPINEGLLIIEREKESTSLFESLLDTPKCINIKADSPDEAQAFLIGAVQSLPVGDPRRRHILSRSIVVKDEQTAIQLPSGESGQLIVVVRDKGKNCAGGLVARGHTVVVPLGNSDRGKTPEITLRRQSQQSFAKGLEAVGVDPERAEIEARQCSSSVTVFQRRNPSSTIELPAWASPGRIQFLVPAVLAGAWSEKNEADRNIFEQLANQPYDRYSEVLHQFLSEDDPPLLRAGDVWSLSAPADAFSLLDQSITQQDLTRLRTCALDVFSEIDPSLDLDPTERSFASLKGKVPRHSSWLRDGLTQTLLLIAILGNRLRFPDGIDQQTFVNNLIKQLPGLNSNTRLLTSLSSQLPVLFEAAPGPFVDALEALLQGNGDIAGSLFTDKDLFIRSPHTGFLWALEGLAWDPEWLPRICLILARLAEIDPGGKYSNRPMRSLREIFLPWHPGTNATLIQRMQTLDLILARYPRIGWDLLSKLLPAFHDVSQPTHEPLWRESGLSLKEVVTQRVLYDSYEEIIPRTLSRVGDFPDRWKIILDALPRFSPVYRKKVYEMLETLCQVGLSEPTRTIISDLLRKLVNRHSAFKDAAWALPDEELDSLAQMVKRMESSNPLERFKWLFDEHYPNLPVSRSNRQGFSKELMSLRCEAIGEIIQKCGIEGVLNFIKMVSYPGTVAGPVFENVKDLESILDIFEQAAPQGQNGQTFSRFLSSLALERYGMEWKDKLLQRAMVKPWSAETLAIALLDWPDDLKTFELVSSLGSEVEHLYWQRRFALLKSESPDICALAINKFIGVGRALDIIALVEYHAPALKSDLLLKVLDAAIKEINEREGLEPKIDYEFEQLLEILRKRDDIERIEVARREYALLPLITHYGERKELVLHEILASDPSFFVEVLCDVYRPASGKKEAVDENRKLRAEFGYQLLESWEVIPGMSPDGTLEAVNFRAWVLKTRELAAQKDRAQIADQEIGKLIAYAPRDPDDQAWPHKAVRELIEELAATEVERGIAIGQFNMRGVVHKAMFEGGGQERDLSKEWRQWARTVGSRWPRTAALLRKISEHWESDAKREDERAEQDRLRFR